MKEVSRELVKKIDEEIEIITKGMADAKIGEIAKPVVEKIANEAGVDAVDLFVDYLDHIALTSKNMVMNPTEDKMFVDSDLDNPGFKLY